MPEPAAELGQSVARFFRFELGRQERFRFDVDSPEPTCVVDAARRSVRVRPRLEMSANGCG
jgi:hypothetical protein